MKICGFDPIKECTDECKYYETCTRNPYKILEQEYIGGRKHMGINEYQKLAMRTANPECKSLSNVGLGIAGEAGEVADMIKKCLHHGHKLDSDHLAKELGDVAWYIALGCEVIGISFEEILRRNIDKLKARYPEGFEVDRSLNRAEGDI